MPSPSTSGPASGVNNTGLQSLDALLGGSKWGGVAGSGVTVTDSFPFTTDGNAVLTGPGACTPTWASPLRPSTA